MPAPDGPTSATRSPCRTVSEKSRSAGRSGRPGYANVTPENTMSPRAGSGIATGTGGAAIPGVASSSSAIRSIAPDAFWTSPATSPTEPIEVTTKIARKMNCRNTPGDTLCSMNVSFAARYTIEPIATKLSTDTTPVSSERILIRASDAANAASTAAPNRAALSVSRPNACTVSIASRLSPANPTAAANRSCAAIERDRTRRPR